MRFLIKVTLIGIVCALLAWWLWPSHGQDSGGSDAAGKSGGKGNGSTPVGVAKIKAGDIDVYLSGLGNVTPTYTVTVHSRVDGQLMRLAFHEGQMVEENDLLAELDARPFMAQLEQAEGQLIRDQALLKEANIDLNRYKTLFAQDSIAKQQLDVQASLVKQYEGAVKNDQGQIDAAKVQVAYTKITSPVSGRVGLRQVDPGNIVHASDANGIVVVTQLQPITAIFTLPEDNIPSVMQRIKGDQELLAEAWDRSSNTLLATGKLAAIDNVVDPTTGTVRFRAEFANQDNALFPSQFVNVKLKLNTLQNVVLAPKAAIQRGSQGSYVYKVNADNTVSVQVVKLGPGEGENVSIQSGLTTGDTVVIDGTDNLREGAKIEIVTPEKREAAPPAAPAPAKMPEKDQKEDVVPPKQHQHKKHPDDTKS